MKVMHNKMIAKNKVIYLVTNLILTSMWTFGMQISFNGSVWGTPEENYIKPFDYITIIHFIVFFLLNGLALWIVSIINRTYNRKMTVNKITNTAGFERIFMKKNVFYSIALFCVIIAWLPYLLAYFPGGVYSDTFNTINLAYEMDEHGMFALNNHHPILYILLWRGAILIGRLFSDELFIAVAIFQIFQFVVMAATLSYLVVWMKCKGLGKGMSIISLAFVMFFPLFPLYAISLWKDTLFSLVLLLYTLCIGDYILDKERDRLNEITYLLRLLFLGFLVAFTRNNGKYIVFLTLAIILITKIKKLFSYRKIVICSVILVITITIIQGPIYDRMNYNVDTTTESLGVPLQQISYLVYYDYDLTEEELNYIESIVSVDSIKERYRPCLFDSIKWDAQDFNSQSIDNNFSQFFKYYMQLMFKHPLGGIKSYMLATAGFWAPNIASLDAYVQNSIWNNSYNLEGVDYLEKYFGFTIRKNLNDITPISSALFLVILIYAGFILLLNRDFSKILLLLPALANWVTIMIATPIACSLRYVYILVLMLPLEAMLICISEKKE